MRFVSFIALCLIFVMLGGCAGPVPDEMEEPSEPTPAQPSTRILRTYHLDPDRFVLVKGGESSCAAGEEGLLEALEAALPGAVTSVQLSDDTATVTLAENWVPQGEAMQLLSLFALVNTACSDDTVQWVTFWSPRGDDWLVSPDGPYAPDDLYLQEGWWNRIFVAAADSGCDAAVLAVPRHFSPLGWMKDDRIIGMSGDHLGYFDLTRDEFVRWNITAWNARVSPGASYVAFQDAENIHYFHTSDPVIHSLQLPLTGEAQGGTRIISWSPDESRLLCSEQREWDATYYLYHLDTGEWRVLDTGVEGYFLIHGGYWLDPETLVFDMRARSMRDGTGGYSEGGFRGDIGLYDLTTDTLSVISDAEDGFFWRTLGTGEEGITLLVADESGRGPIARWETPGETTPTVLSELSFSTGFVGAGGHAAAVAPGPNEWGSFPWFNLHVLEGEELSHPLRIRGSSSYPLAAAWSSDGRKLVVTFRRPDIDDVSADDHPEVRSTVLIRFER